MRRKLLRTGLFWLKFQRARNLRRFASAVLRTLLRSDGLQPSSSPGVPSAWRAQAQKLKLSWWVAISPSGVKVKRASMRLSTLRPVALNR